jgi:hypothetical protein
MIYWIIFDPGVGGDGFSNMLEHATNIEPVDGVSKWRNQETSAGKIRFNYPQWINPTQWFRCHNSDFNYEIQELTVPFQTLIENNKNVVIPVHKLFFEVASKLKFQNLLQIENIKICLYSTNNNRVFEDYVDKQDVISSEQIEGYRKFTSKRNSMFLPYSVRSTNQICYIDIDKSWSDWNYLNEILISIGIDLPKEKYEEYLDISKRRPKTV